MKTVTFTYKTQPSDEGKRIDIVLAARPEIASRNFAQHLISNGAVKVDNRLVNKSHKAVIGQIIYYEIPDPEEAEVQPQNIPLDIVYEDDDLAVVNKQAGLVVHPAYGHWEGTLVNALLYHLKGLSAIGGVKRPGIVHRLDKDTSGLMIVAKNDFAHISLSEAIKKREVERQYLALVHGSFNENSFTVEAPIGRSPLNRKKMAVTTGGRYAKTNAYKVREYKNYTLLRVSLVTGRTHQVRVHMAYIGHPIACDEVYGKPSDMQNLGLTRHFLHAFKLSFNHPRTGENLSFESQLPEELQKVLDKLI